MAQLLDTTVNGDLEVTGNISSTSIPTSENHVVTKGYLEEVNKYYVRKLAPIGSNSNGAGNWKQFTTSNYDVSLKKGTYLITVSCLYTATGTGLITTRVLNNNVEIDSDIDSTGKETGWRCTRQTTPCDSTRYVSTNSTFLYTLNSDTNCSFRPEAYGSATWTGHRATISIVRIS